MIDLLQQGVQPVPPIVAPSTDLPVSTEVQKFDPTVLDYKIKRAGTFGGLSIAGVLYLVGVLVILKLMGIWPFNCTPVTEVTSTLSRVVECTHVAIGEGAWHGIAGVMLALFSVPTVLLIAILRTASAKREPLPDTVYTTAADKFANALERVFEPKK
nr:hypothetical protein [uncultured Roseateles sp.]